MTLAASKAGKVVLKNFNNDAEVIVKTSHQDIVTKTDVASQEAIKKLIRAELLKLKVNPDDICFISEEDKNITKPKKHTFIIDPIDGTTNFASKIRYFGISIAYANFSSVKLGLIYDPVNKTKFWGEQGKGSWVKYDHEPVTKLNLKTNPKVSNWVLSCHYNGLEVINKQFAQYKKVYPAVRGLRTLGCLTLELCELAAGHIDVVLNGGTYIWDLAAAKLILEQAGGKIYTPAGKNLSLNFKNPSEIYQLVACDKKLKKKVSQLLK